MRNLPAIVSICLTSYFPATHSHAAENSPTSKPNIIFILADDLGWAELPCFGNQFNETPHLDAMTTDGIRFTQAYASAPVCSPYRAALLTGKHPVRTGILDYLRPNSANALSTRHKTLPQRLQEHGYTTGMIGKWHLSGYEYHEAEYELRPADHGFSWNIASEVKGVGNGANFWPYQFRQQPIRWLDLPERRLGDSEYLIDRMNLEAVDFIERHRNEPFFLYLSHYAIHSILNGRPDLVNKYRHKHAPGTSTRTKCYLCQDRGLKGDPLHHWAGDHNPHLAAMLESIDDGIGLIREKLKELKLDKNTIIVFTSDNGGETNVTSNAPLRGGKSQLYEGGIRVPQIVVWPDVAPAGTVCHQPTTNTDFFPTFLEAAGIELTAIGSLDGQSQIQSWRNPEYDRPREPLFWHYPLDRPHFLGGVSAGAIRDGDWKLIEHFGNGKTELFCLPDDPSEKQDLSSQHPEKVSALLTRLRHWQQANNATIPSAPLLVDPRQLKFGDHFSSDRASERWSQNSEWTVENDELHRVKGGTDSTRVFLKDAEFQNSLIRFDFRFDESSDIRLVTGSGGHYNSVVHIRRDHFFLQTAKDPDEAFFSFRHGECAFDFTPGRWYTMTVEYLDDQMIAHIDQQHGVSARHPIIDRTRTYFAFQIDANPAQIDNVQIFHAGRHKRLEENRPTIERWDDANPVRKTPAEEFSILKSNSHEWFYQRSPEYAGLVQKVEKLDTELKASFPAAFQSHKETRKAILALRKRLLAEDARFKELLFATYRANRNLDSFLLEKHPEIDELPKIRRKYELETTRKRYIGTDAYSELLEQQRLAQQQLESAYPQLFVSDAELKQQQITEREAIKSDSGYQRKKEQRATAWRAQEAFLFDNEPRLQKLRDIINRDK